MSRHRILFVCLGNICRSPTAEGIFRRLARERGLEDLLEIDSAGTGNWHVGNPPERRAIEEAKRRGIDISNMRARQVRPEDLKDFDHVLAMDLANLDQLEALRERLISAGAPESVTRPRLLLSYGQGLEETEVPDPYFEGGFDYVFDLIENAASGLLEELEKQLAQPNKNT